MANYPRKMQDPSETALTAIQEALSATDANRHNGEQPQYEPQRQPTASRDMFLDEPLDQPPPRRAANDDRQSIGQILQSLQRQPPKTSYVVATVFAFLWVAVGVLLAVLYLPNLQAVLTQGSAGIPAMVGLAAFVLAPILFFYLLAHMVWRSQELRLIAQSMAGVAMRLAEPEEVARDSIVSVGQAIRREVAAMGDGVERALARAAELEALVANEVSALERAYHDNEVRIRGLLESLSQQRDTLVSQAETVRNALSTVHLELSQDISSVSDHVTQRVNESAQKIAHALTEKGEHITLALGRAGDAMIGALGERGGDLLERLERTSTETTDAIANASDRLTSSLNFKTDHITEEFSELTTNLTQLMETRLDDVTQGFAQKSTSIIDTMDSRSQQIVQLMEARSQQISDSLIDNSSQLAEAIVTRGDEVNSTLKSTGDSLVLDISLRGSDVVGKLQQTGAQITNSIIERGDKVAEQFRASAEELASNVTQRGDAVRELLAARLQAFEEMFSQGGTELAEKISRDSATLGGLITRHLAEFDRTVKTYGGEIVERLGARTQEVSDAMRTYVDSFDSKVSTKSTEVTASLDQRLLRFQEALDSRTQTLNEALSARVMDIAKTLAEGGKEVVASLDRRIVDVTSTISARGEALGDTLTNKIADLDKTLGIRAIEVANNLDTRIGRFEQLLVGRAETVTEQIETRTRAAADVLRERMEELADRIQTNSSQAEQALSQLAGETQRSLGGVTEQAQKTLGAVTGELQRTIGNATGELQRTIGTAAGELERTVTTASTTANAQLKQSIGEAERQISTATAGLTSALKQSSGDLERQLTSVSTGVSNVLRQNATDVERTLLGVSAEVARTFVGKADEIAAQVSQRAGEMTKVLDINSSTLLTALNAKSKEFSSEIGKATDHAVKSIEAQGFAYTRTMMDNSEQIARLVNEASLTATTAVNRSLKELQDGTKAAIDQSSETATASVSEILETHNMLRADTTNLFERLREANILLQEVLSGAHKNMSSLENTLVTRVAEFVSTMNEVAQQSGAASNQVDQHIASFQTVTGKVLADLAGLAGQFETHGRSLVEAVALIETSNRRSEDAFSERRASIETVASSLDTRTADIEQRLSRFHTLLDESLQGATNRARDIARIIAESTAQGIQSMETERQRSGSELHKLYSEHSTQASEMFNQTTQRFTEALLGIKQMTADMQRELEATRAELRRGILEIPTETAESAAQMRRVIVDQIEALAELNRIVARHGRGLDAAEPARRTVREEQPMLATAHAQHDVPRMEAPRQAPPSAPRGERPAAPPPPAQPRRTEAPSLSPTNANGGARGGWLSDLLHRASRPEEPATAERAPRQDERTPRHSIESLDSLSVDIARMIDHDAAAELWDRYKRGERNVFTRRLYTIQGQKTFDEIQRKYRGDREFKQTVDRYIGEFERLLEDVARDDRGQVMARTYLTSETGKVYTMLAHAAGRFGSE